MREHSGQDVKVELAPSLGIQIREPIVVSNRTGAQVQEIIEAISENPDLLRIKCEAWPKSESETQ